MTDQEHATAMEQVKVWHDKTLSVEVQLDFQKALELRNFNEVLKQHLTDEQLEFMAEQCWREKGDDHCVYCAAWSELVNRRGSN